MFKNSKKGYLDTNNELILPLHTFFLLTSQQLYISSTKVFTDYEKQNISGQFKLC